MTYLKDLRVRVTLIGAALFNAFGVLLVTAAPAKTVYDTRFNWFAAALFVVIAGCALAVTAAIVRAENAGDTQRAAFLSNPPVPVGIALAMLIGSVYLVGDALTSNNALTRSYGLVAACTLLPVGLAVTAVAISKFRPTTA